MRTLFSFLLVMGIMLSAMPAHATQVIAARQGKGIEMAVSQGRLVRLNGPASAVFVADSQIADIQVKSPRLVYLTALNPGQTTLYAVGDNEQVLLNMKVHVTHDLSGLRQSIQKLHPGLDVKVASINESIILDGMVENASVAESLRRLAASFTKDEAKVINRVGVIQPTQVNLRVRIAEVARDIDKQLGINWDFLGNIGKAAFSFDMANFFTADAGRNAIAGGYYGAWSLTAMIEALENEGLITVLAEPNLTAMSGQTASFLAGGEFPIITGGDDDRVIIRFKEYGVSLAFTPTVLDGNRINLHVRPEVSQLTTMGSISLPLSGGVLEVPALSTRRAETVVELGSGQSFAIGGLLQNNIIHEVSKFPGLGDIPVLGRLFRSDRFRHNESELVIIVTPYLVKPVKSPDLMAPTDGLQTPTDRERIGRGGVSRQASYVPQPIHSGPGGTELVGRVGFLME